MVNFRLLKPVYLFAILAFNNVCFASEPNHIPQLILFTDKTESVLGRPIRAELYGISLKSKITDINLTHLNDNFGVITDYVIDKTSDKRWPNKSIQILKLKLYPRRTGNITIPGFSAGKIQSHEKTINIIKGNSSPPEIKVSIIEPYEQQQIIVIVSVTSPDSSSRLSIEDNPELNDFDIVPLPFKRTQDQNTTYQLKIGWAVNALKSGKLKLELPVIEHSVSGVSRKKYYLPALTLNVKKLPSYLSPTIPVGNITIQSHPSTTSILQTNTLAYWNIRISGNLNNTYSLPPVLRQIKSNKHIKFLPVTSERSIATTNNGLTSTIQHSIPFKVLKSGFLNFPEIRLQYFDPDNGKLKTFVYKADNIIVLSVFWRSIFGLVIVFLSVFIFRIWFKKWQRLKFSKKKHGQAILLLQENSGVREIRESISLLAEAEYWPGNITLHQWSEFWIEKYQVSDGFNELMNELSAILYSSKKQHNSEELGLHLLDLIRNRKKQ